MLYCLICGALFFHFEIFYWSCGSAFASKNRFAEHIFTLQGENSLIGWPFFEKYAPHCVNFLDLRSIFRILLFERQKSMLRKNAF